MNVTIQRNDGPDVDLDINWNKVYEIAQVYYGNPATVRVDLRRFEYGTILLGWFAEGSKYRGYIKNRECGVDED